MHNSKLFKIQSWLAFCFIFFSPNVLSQETNPPSETTSSATVTQIKGGAYKISSSQQKIPLQVGQKVEVGESIMTSDNSALKLVFSDGSEVSLGPSSNFTVETFEKQKAGTLSLAFGWLRAKVSKSVSGDTKMLIKTPTSVMGVRGTDFETVYNSKLKLTSLVTYEGSVALAKYTPAADTLAAGRPTTSIPVNNTDLIKKLSDSSQSMVIGSGQFSGIAAEQKNPTIPVKISPAQFQALKDTTPFTAQAQSALSTQKSVFISPIPPGVDSKALSAAPSDELNKIELKTEALATPKATAPTEGSYDAKSGKVAPPAGGFFDRKTGLLIPPPPGSAFDPITGVYIPPANLGTVDQSGNFVPAHGLVMDEKRGLVQQADVAKPIETRPLSATPLVGIAVERIGASMIAAPPPPGEDAMKYLSKPGFIPPDCTIVVSKGYGTTTAVFTAPTSLYKVAFFDLYRPRYPVYDYSLCPPYCDPRFKPGTYAAQTDTNKTSVTFTITQE